MTHNKVEVYAKALPCVKFSLDTAARVCVLVFFFFFLRRAFHMIMHSVGLVYCLREL